jgi:hypothetical protein
MEAVWPRQKRNNKMALVEIKLSPTYSLLGFVIKKIQTV